MAKLLDELRRTAALWGLRQRPGVVAVSGGADSVALLRGLLEVGVPVIVGHFNHQLRGAESDADEAFVRDLAATLGVRCEVGAADVATVAAERKGNLEATARELRYEWLAQLGEWVATGHTADDQAETVLHRLVRGTGVQGLRGIAPSRELGSGVWLVRPLLTCTRSEVLAYLADRNQPFRNDSSNADLAFTRNRIRAELLPLVKSFNPDAVAALGRLARQADETTQFVQVEAGKLLRERECPRAGPLVVLDVREPLPAFLGREVFRLVWEREGWPADGMTADHWQRVADVAAGEVAAADFPGGVHVRRVGVVVQLASRK